MSTKGGPVLTFLLLACQGGCSTCCAPVIYATVHVSYSALKTNEEESTPVFTQNHHGCLAISRLMICLIFCICSLKL